MGNTFLFIGSFRTSGISNTSYRITNRGIIPVRSFSKVFCANISILKDLNIKRISKISTNVGK